MPAVDNILDCGDLGRGDSYPEFSLRHHKPIKGVETWEEVLLSPCDPELPSDPPDYLVKGPQNWTLTDLVVHKGLR